MASWSSLEPGSRDLVGKSNGLANVKGAFMSKIRPLGDKVLVRRVEAEKKTAGGIVLPDAAKEKPKRGKIIAVGEGRLLDDGKRAKMQVKKGDEVLFSSYAGTEITVGKKEMMIMSEDDILAIIG